ncbi:MAG: DEAD/DEAH box helicase [Proteobacteria bacterium]|nr:DEAD/DEAH box helicase [Pseudomonadota bacterium]
MALDSPIPQPSTNSDHREDIFFYDTEKMQTLTSDGIIKHGLAYFKENRVTDMGRDDVRLWAHVEGNSEDVPYLVELESAGVDGIHATCQCANSPEPVCKHAIALLYYYVAQLPNTDLEIDNALGEAIEERVKRGRTEVNVTQVSGELRFGYWEASSITSATHRPQTYKVHIRSLTERNNYCSCPDFATNQLGTCKHIEAVLHRVSKDSDYETIKNQPPPHPFVYLDWESENAPQIKVKRVGHCESDLDPILDENFDAQGFFKGRLPEGFFKFADAVYGRSDFYLGEDVRLYTQRLAADISHAMRAQKIKDRISETNGRLPGVKARLYPYQVEGVAFMAATGRCLLADDMGLGKTLQSIAAAIWLIRDEEIEKVLVVCPASLKHQWAREIEKFTEYDTQIIQGSPENRQVQYRKGKTFVIVNYELVLRDLTVINEVLRPDLVILDEAQRIKNWRTKIASTIKLIPSTYAFVLSGTPLENRLEDLYSLMQVVDPHVLGPLWKYLLDFHVTDDRDKVLGYRNLSVLRRRIQPVMLRRDRRLVRDQLPGRTEIRLDVPLDPKQRDLHDNALSAAGRLAQIAKRRPLTPSEQHRLMAALQTARMACNAAGLVDKETVGSPKLDELAVILEDLCLQIGLKVVVFSQWERMTRMVEELLNEMKIGCVRLHGGIPTANRGEIMDKFRLDDATQVFVSTDAGGVGLNLQSGSALVNLDMPWNPAVLEQRIARIHRLGQKNKVQIIKMVGADSYEENVLHLLAGKQNLFNNVIDPDADEDVVGVSKRMLETLIEDLVEEPEKESKSTDNLVETIPSVDDVSTEEVAASEISDAVKEEIEEDQTVRICIERIQKEYGPRIERIVGSSGGLLVIMTLLREEDDAIAAELSAEIPVALMDPRTYAGLQRLGASSPVANMQPLFEPSEGTDEEHLSPLLILAKEKLKAAEALVEQNCPSVCLELLAASMVAAVAAETDAVKPPELADATVWIYSEALPKKLLNDEQAGTIIRAISLLNASALPDELILQVLEDAERLVDHIETS